MSITAITNIVNKRKAKPTPSAEDRAAIAAIVRRNFRCMIDEGWLLQAVENGHGFVLVNICAAQLR